MVENADALLEVAASARATDATLMVVFFECYRRLCNDCANLGTILPEFGTRRCLRPYHLSSSCRRCGGRRRQVWFELLTSVISVQRCIRDVHWNFRILKQI